MVEQIFLSPQVKRSMIISNRLIYTKSLTNCQTTYCLRKSGNMKKVSKLIESLPGAQSIPEMKILLVLIKISWKIEIELLP